MNTEDRFFEEIFHKELEMGHAEHLSFAMLWGYAASRLEPELAEKVSLHLASCGRCLEDLRAIREERRALAAGTSQVLSEQRERLAHLHRMRFREGVRRLGEKFFAPRALYRHALVYVTVGVLVLVLNFWMNQMPGLLGPGQRGWWALWVLIPWGILVVWHTWRAWRR
uniref:2TM domain-containing protein n=1 Tax=Acetithermum autotrophicum TaxID=1446466 RepID=H5SSP4_ACEAU|nr:hypothetical protein HGMM_OP3C341 [Candidatus Acetothermum autotrophicum]